MFCEKESRSAGANDFPSIPGGKGRIESLPPRTGKRLRRDGENDMKSFTAIDLLSFLLHHAKSVAMILDKRKRSTGRRMQTPAKRADWQELFPRVVPADGLG